MRVFSRGSFKNFSYKNDNNKKAKKQKTKYKQALQTNMTQ